MNSDAIDPKDAAELTREIKVEANSNCPARIIADIKDTIQKLEGELALRSQDQDRLSVVDDR